MQSVKKNYLYYLLMLVTNIMFPVLVFPYIARQLGPDGLGDAQFALQYSKYFAIVASLGIPVYGVREVAKVKHRKMRLNKLVSELIILNIITSLISAVIYVGTLYYSNVLSLHRELFFIAGLQVLLGCLSVDWIFVGLEDFKIITIRSLAIRLLTVVFLFVYVHSPDDVIPYLLISVLSIVLGYLWIFFYALKQIKLLWRGLSFINHLQPIFLIFLMNVCISMYTVFDTAWIGFLSTSVAVGFYSAAIKLAKIGIPFVTSLGTVLIPRSARTFAANIEQPVHLQTSYNFIVDLSIPMGVGLFMLAPELIFVLSGPEFNEAIWAMRLLSFLPFIIGLSNLFGIQILTAAGHEKSVLVSVFLGMLLNIILNLLWVPQLHHNGGALAILFTESFVTLITFYFCYTKYKINFGIKRILQALLLSIVAIPVVYFLRFFAPNHLFVLCGSIIITASLYLLLQWIIFKNEFIQQAIDLFKTKRLNEV